MKNEKAEEQDQGTGGKTMNNFRTKQHDNGKGLNTMNNFRTKEIHILLGNSLWSCSVFILLSCCLF